MKANESLVDLFIEHNYSVPSGTLLKILEWLDKLKDDNEINGIFPEELFENEIEFQKQNFIRSYFINRKMSKKVKPFIKLPVKYKIQVLNYYIHKYFK